jgi:NADPH-dependent curcumin reductase CurA
MRTYGREPPVDTRVAPDRRTVPRDSELRETEVPEPGEREVLVRTLYRSVDP